MRSNTGVLAESNLVRESSKVAAVRAAASVVFILFALLVGGCSKPAEKAVDVITPNKALDQRYIDAILHNDAAVVMSTYLNSPDTFEIEADGTLLMGYDAIKAYYEKLFADVEFQEGKLVEQDYQAHGGAVVGYGKYWVKLKSKQDGKEQEMTGRYLDVRAQRDGKWYYVSNMEVTIAPEMPVAPATSEAPAAPKQ
jgi:ketosteroid isomerase-like protein